jgi:AGCS family alanine or glycine:cation symporter
LGGPGAAFWMWLIALLGSATAFVESTLAQIYKKRDADGSSYGGPAYYIQKGIGWKPLAIAFAVFLILTYWGGFNMVAAFNVAQSFQGYHFFDPKLTPAIVGVVLAVLVGVCIFGGGKRLARVTEFLVPIMAVIYIAAALIVMLIHVRAIPGMFAMIFEKAFDFKAIFGGFSGSCVMYGIKRGLYSNEAGVGSAPNAAASASVSHPVKQGLVQMLSVYIDTILICTATMFMLLSSGVVPDAADAGMPYVQKALAGTFGSAGYWFITAALSLFAFTTLIGNYFYAEQNIKYLAGGMPGTAVMVVFRFAALALIFVGTQLAFDVAWSVADILMGLMALINIPVIFALQKPAIDCLKDYYRQKRAGKDPVFKKTDIGLEHEVDYWD